MAGVGIPGCVEVRQLAATPLWQLYCARRQSDGGDVAVRIVEVAADERTIATALAEAAQAATAQGAASVRTIRLPDADGRLVLESETGPGESLAVRLAAGPMAVVRALEIAAEIAAALAALHRAGLAHHALTPADVWLRPHAGVLLLGGGVRHLLGTVWPASLDPLTAAYAAPERLRGLTLTPAADVWTLAALLVEMVTGRRAFGAATAAEVSRQVLEGRPPRLEGVRTGVDPELNRFLVRAFERDPSLRSADMAAIESDLRRMVELLAPVTELGTADGVVAPTGTNIAGVTAASFRAPVAPGDTIGGFKVLEQLGRGGMGLVYRAQDRRLGRQVALKFLPRAPGGGQPPERFIQEAKAASALDHPNICTIYGVDETPDGDTYIAMALYEGPSLRDLLDGGPLPMLEALRIAVQVVAGLAAAHARGIVHCDIKPGNIVLAEDGTAKIVDFGISRIGHSPVETGDGFAGTAGYAAPEQVQRGPIDQRVDLWAVGVLLYEMVAGERPFPGQGARAMMATVESDPQPLSERVEELPNGLEAVVERALARAPAARYQNATELLLDLDRILGAVSGRDARARTRQRLLVAGVGVAVVAAAMGMWVVRQRAGSAASATTPRLALAGVRAVPATSGERAAAWLGSSIEELVRLELADLGGLEVVAVDPVLTGPHEGRPEFWAGADSEALANLGAAVAASYVAVGTFEVAGPPDRPSLELELRVRPAAAEEAMTVVGARGPPDDLVSLIDELVAGVAGDLGRARRPAVASGEWRPFADDEVAQLHREAVARLRVLDAVAARPLLERALAIEPGNPTLALSLADALADLGRDSEAADQVEVAAASFGAVPRAVQVFIQARRLEARRESDRAAAAYRGLWAGGHGCVVAGESPTDGAVRLATALVRAGRAEEAVVIVAAPPFAEASDPRLDMVRSEAYHWLGRYDPQLATAQRAVAGARAATEPLLLARALRLLADADWRLGRLDDGIEALAEAARLYERAAHRKGEADIAAMTGVLLFERGELWQAKAAYDRAAGLYSTIGNRRAQARTLTNKALVLEQQGDLDATISVTREALELFRASGDRVAELISLVNLTSALTSRGRLEEARAAIDGALAIMHEVSRFEAWTLLQDSDLLVATGELVEAAAQLGRAAEIQEATGDRVGQALTTVRNARLLLLQGAVGEACERYEEAVPVLADRGTPLEHATALRGFGDALRAHGELARSHDLLRQALEIQATVTARAGRSETLLSLAATERELGHLDAAEAAAREALADLELRGVVASIAAGRALLAHLALERGDLDSAAAEVERARAALAERELPLARMRVELVALEIAAATSDAAAREGLQRLLGEATSRGFVEIELQVMLALGSSELAAGHKEAGRSRLEGAAADARLKGLVTVARRAEALLAGGGILPTRERSGAD